jgi:S1-C subfamily serine protease
MNTRRLSVVVLFFLVFPALIHTGIEDKDYKQIYKNAKSALASKPATKAAMQPLADSQEISDALGNSLESMSLFSPYMGEKQNIKGIVGELASYKFTLRSAKSSEIYQNAVNATVLVVTPEIGSGAGFVIDKAQGLIITNYHVTSGLKNLLVAFYDPNNQDPSKLKFHPATVIRYSAKRDVAVLKLKSVPAQLSELKLDETKQAVGNDVHLIGHPLSLVWTYSRGMVTALRSRFQFGDENFADVIQIDASISPGNSGGPLLDEIGSVIGMVTFSNVGENAQNLNFAVTAREVKEFLALVKNEDTTVSEALKKMMGKELFSVADAMSYYNAYKVDQDKDGKYDYISLVDKKTNKEVYRFAKEVELEVEPGKKQKVNMLIYDIDKDEVWDVMFIDSDLNGTFELVFVDMNGDGEPDIVGTDPEGKGIITEAWIL